MRQSAQRENGRGTRQRERWQLLFPVAPFGSVVKPMPDPVRNLTGAVCHDYLLGVDVPWSGRTGFTDQLGVIFGSYHLNDYGMFYDALRRNAIDPVTPGASHTAIVRSDVHRLAGSSERPSPDLKYPDDIPSY